MNRFRLSVVVLVLVLLIAAPLVSAKELRVVMITPYGEGVPFGDAAYQGLMDAARDFSLNVRLIEAREPSEYQPQMRAMADLGYDVVIAMHDYFAEDMVTVAAEYPEVTFVLIDSYKEAELDNFRSIAIESHHASFAAGMTAGYATESKHVGFIGGLDHPIIIQFLAGYEAGLHYVDPDIKISVAFSGVFDDPVQGREMALNMFSGGADVIMHAADYTGLGVLRAAREVGKFGIGVDTDQADVAPGHVLASAIKDVHGAVYYVVEEIVAGDFTPELLVFGPEHGAQLTAIPTDIEFYQKNPEVLEKLEEAIEKIRTGEIEVPYTTETR
ncbi:MAG TPA: BMP family ABC transporter substrate-binding protein [Firmicutes bacterium]|nr:BMP family ABC transporter substrate-binding protein [Bacillota bacterium]